MRVLHLWDTGSAGAGTVADVTGGVGDAGAGPAGEGAVLFGSIAAGEVASAGVVASAGACGVSSGGGCGVATPGSGMPVTEPPLAAGAGSVSVPVAWLPSVVGCLLQALTKSPASSRLPNRTAK
jgi:hypothetical protein